MNYLITGITGFLGNEISKFLAANRQGGIYGTYFVTSELRTAYKDKVAMLPCDIKDKGQVDNAVKTASPKAIFHMAAQTYLMPSWADPIGTYATNTNGTVNLFEAARHSGLDPVVVVACSSGEYGDSNKGVPLKETDLFLPISPYGVSKVIQDLIAYQYFRNYGVKTIRARIFNTIGPRKTKDFVEETCRQIINIERGLQKPVIKVGNIETKRDLTDARDTVRGLVMLSEKGRPGEAYNVCSGRAVKISWLLDTLLSYAKVKIDVEVDKSRIRPGDESIILGDNTRIKSEIGWEPTIDLKTTLKDALDYWRVVIPQEES